MLTPNHFTYMIPGTFEKMYVGANKEGAGKAGGRGSARSKIGRSAYPRRHVFQGVSAAVGETRAADETPKHLVHHHPHAEYIGGGTVWLTPHHLRAAFPMPVSHIMNHQPSWLKLSWLYSKPVAANAKEEPDMPSRSLTPSGMALRVSRGHGTSDFFLQRTRTCSSGRTGEPHGERPHRYLGHEADLSLLDKGCCQATSPPSSQGSL